MSRLLAIDPGLRCCGVALAEDGRLVACGLVKNPHKVARNGIAWGAMAQEVALWARPFGDIERVRCETPQVYLPGHTAGKRVDPSDLLNLQGVVGAICATFDRVETVLPSDWKGQLPKDVCEGRVKLRLDEAEREVLAGVYLPPSLRHNVADAVGILLDGLGRFKRTA